MLYDGIQESPRTLTVLQKVLMGYERVCTFVKWFREIVSLTSSNFAFLTFVTVVVPEVKGAAKLAVE